MNTKVPRLALTLGEPAGIGPDILLALAQNPFPVEVVVVGSPELLHERAKQLSLQIELYDFTPHSTQKNGNGRVAIVPVDLKSTCTAGELNVKNSAYVLETLQNAVELCLDNTCQAMVTGPVHKAIIAQSGIAFSGHTEYLAKLANVKNVLMSFFSPSMIVALATTHHPLNKVSALITKELLEIKIHLLREGLIHYFQKPEARIRVCGLNPHAGESGLLGSEEETIIKPVIEAFQAKGMQILGPVPADTAFGDAHNAPCDAILAMYHDQGLAPIKALHFREIVNVTLGLPFLRTSVDHGTALPIAGSGKADPSSLFQALSLAATLSQK